MSDKLKEAKKGSSNLSVTSSSTTLTDVVKEQKTVPEGAKILSKTIRIDVEEIENGWLITKNFDIKYKEKGKEYNDYAYYSKKWYSKDQPLDVKMTDVSLADEFNDEES